MTCHEEKQLGESRGWTAIPRSNDPMWHNFRLGVKNLWLSRQWVAADLIDGDFKNHRQYPTLEAALDAETI